MYKLTPNKMRRTVDRKSDSCYERVFVRAVASDVGRNQFIDMS